MMIQTVVLVFFFTALTISLLSVVVFLERPVGCLLLSSPVVFLFHRTFQIVVLAIRIVLEIPLMDFPPLLSFRMTCFVPQKAFWSLTTIAGFTGGNQSLNCE